MPFRLLPEASVGYEQDTGQKFPSRQGAHAFEEVTPNRVQQGDIALPLPEPTLRMPEIIFSFNS